MTGWQIDLLNIANITVENTARTCEVCKVPLPANARPYQRFCCDKHRWLAKNTRTRSGS